MTVGTVGSLSRHHHSVVIETIKVAEHLLNGDHTPNSWSIANISPLAAYHLTDESMRETLEMLLMGKSKTDIDAAFVYVKLLQHLMMETLTNPSEIYQFVLETAEKLQNKRLYITAKLMSMLHGQTATAEDLFGRNRDIHDVIQNLMIAIHTFVSNANNPEYAMVTETSKTAPDSIYTIKLVGEMCGALYGYEWMPMLWVTSHMTTESLAYITALSHRLTLVSQ